MLYAGVKVGAGEREEGLSIIVINRVTGAGLTALFKLPMEKEACGRLGFILFYFKHTQFLF